MMKILILTYDDDDDNELIDYIPQEARTDPHMSSIDHNTFNPTDTSNNLDPSSFTFIDIYSSPQSDFQISNPLRSEKQTVLPIASTSQKIT